KPPPVPDWATFTATSGCSSSKASAAASANGPTVLDPSMTTSPLRAPLVSPGSRSSVVPPHAAAAKVSASAAGMRPRLRSLLVTLSAPRSYEDHGEAAQDAATRVMKGGRDEEAP